MPKKSANAPINLDKEPGIEEPVLLATSPHAPVTVETLTKAVQKIAADLGFSPIAWALRDVEIVIVFENGQKLKFDAAPGPEGKHVQIL